MEIYEGNNWKLYKIFKKVFKCVILPPNRCDRGVDLPIPMTINSSSFGLLSVNEAQDLMLLKFKAFLIAIAILQVIMSVRPSVGTYPKYKEDDL